MRAGIDKPVVFVVISVLVVTLMYSSFSAFYTPTFYVFAAKPTQDYTRESLKGTCSIVNTPDFTSQTCCWQEPGDEKAKIKHCQTCTLNDDTGKYDSCGDVYTTPAFTLEQPPVQIPDVTEVAPPPPPGPRAPLGTILPGGEVFQGLQQTPPSPPRLGEIAPELASPTAPQVEPPPTTAEDGSQQPPNEPLCQEGFERDEETGLCVPIESQQDTEQQEQEQDEPQQEETEEESSSEKEDGN